VPVACLHAVVEARADVVAAVKAAGYRYVTLDLEGLRSGNLNQALALTTTRSPGHP
jgi:pyridinium-3,5-biscarboxylic acid mononucleotide sulfurtransferase